MDKVTNYLVSTKLFHEISEPEISQLLNELDAKIKTYKNNEPIYQIGELISTIGVIVSGEVYVTNTDFWGNNNLVRIFLPGDFFGESHSITHEPMFFDMTANGKCVVIHLNAEKLLFLEGHPSEARHKLHNNMVMMIGKKKSSYLHEIDCLNKRTTKGKLLAFLSEQARNNGSNTFYIKYNRQELAEHLAVDRSALSRELAKLETDGYLHSNKNYFDLRYDILDYS